MPSPLTVRHRPWWNRFALAGAVCALVAVGAGLLCLPGCDDGPVGRVAKVAAEGETVRAAPLALPLESPLRFTVTGVPRAGWFGAPSAPSVPGAIVVFDVVRHPEGSPGTLEKTQTVADAGGVAVVGFTPGDAPGIYVVRARAGDGPDAPADEVVVLGGVEVTGGGQDGWTGGMLENNLSVRVETAPGVYAKNLHARFDVWSGSATPLAEEPAPDAAGRVETAVRVGGQGGVGTLAVVLVDSPLGPEAARYPVKIRYYALHGFTLLVGVLGGLALFIYGMKMMSDGLQFMAGERLKALLGKLTSSRFTGVLAGLGVTALIQSSSASTVMVVGFVNAGLMRLEQAIGVIMGANIGTTVTAQIISFNLEDLALPAVAAGVLWSLLAKSRRGRYGAQILIGFGLLFLGLTLMSAELKGLKDSALASDFFAGLSCLPDASGGLSLWAILKAVFAGMIVTFVVQSSSATTGLLIALAAAGLLDPYAAFAILLGENIGTTITAVLASLGASVPARQTAAFHVLFNVSGAVLMVILMFVPWPGMAGRPIFMEFVNRTLAGDVFAGENLPRFIANAHTLFNVVCTLGFLALVNQAARLCRAIFPDMPATGASTDPAARPAGPRVLEPHLLSSPGIALEQSWTELARLLRVSRHAYESGIRAILKPVKDEEEWEALYAHARRDERETDDGQVALTEYLGQLGLGRLTERQAETVPRLLHAVNDVERVGDHSVRLLKLGRRVRKRSLPFTDESYLEMQLLLDGTESMFDLAEQAVSRAGRMSEAERALALEENRQVHRLVKNRANEFRKNHERRHEAGDCDIRSGVVFVDYLQNVKRVAGLLENVVLAACAARNF